MVVRRISRTLRRAAPAGLTGDHQLLLRGERDGVHVTYDLDIDLCVATHSMNPAICGSGACGSDSLARRTEPEPNTAPSTRCGLPQGSQRPPLRVFRFDGISMRRVSLPQRSTIVGAELVALSLSACRSLCGSLLESRSPVRPAMDPRDLNARGGALPARSPSRAARRSAQPPGGGGPRCRGASFPSR